LSNSHENSKHSRPAATSWWTRLAAKQMLLGFLLLILLPLSTGCCTRPHLEVSTGLPPGKPTSRIDELKKRKKSWSHKTNGLTLLPTGDLFFLLAGYNEQLAWGMALEMVIRAGQDR
jgi:hypothetical protein